jgi:hypothetical protein
LTLFFSNTLGGFFFGGGKWEHEIKVEKIHPAGANWRARWRMWDRGVGLWGILKRYLGPSHPEHKEMLEWIGGEFDPEGGFDKDA